jgi:hypothetical protein
MFLPSLEAAQRVIAAAANSREAANAIVATIAAEPFLELTGTPPSPRHHQKI